MYACSIQRSCQAEQLCYRPCVVPDSRTAVAFSFFLQSKICLPWKNGIRMSRNHNPRSISSPFPGSQHISHLINMNILKPGIHHFLTDILRFLPFFMRRRRNLTHFQVLT